MNVQQLLQNLGFSRNEVAVYLAALGLGEASAAAIAKRAKLKRTSAYPILEALINRGVVSTTKQRGKTRYQSQPPVTLLALVSGLATQLEAALPELDALYQESNSAKPRVTFYEGPEAIQNVYDDTLREQPAEILEWNTDRYFERFPRNHNYIDKRVALGMKARRMAGAGSRWHLAHRKYDDIELSETLIVPAEQFSPDIEVNIYSNKVAFLNYAEDMSLIIESPAIAHAMKQAYELSWQGGKQVEVQSNVSTQKSDETAKDRV